MYMKEASYTMEKVNDEYKLKEVVDGVAQFVGDSISSTGQGEIVGSWGEPIEINNYYIRKNYLPIMLAKNKNNQPLKVVNSFINYLDEETNMDRLFKGCNKLTYIRDIKTSQVNNFLEMFYGCSSLETIPEIDFSAILKPDGDEILTRDMFYKCYKLKNIKIKNFPAKTTIEGYEHSYGLDFSDCYNLTTDSVINILQNICITTSVERKYSRLLILNTKFENYIKETYCKIINNKANNLPMVICEKTEPESLSLYDYFQKKEMNLTFWDA